MDKCPVCGGRLSIAKIESKYKRDWLPFVKTYKEQVTYMVCQNANFKTVDKEVLEDGRKVTHYEPVPCPMYCGPDLNNPVKVVEVIKAKVK